MTDTDPKRRRIDPTQPRVRFDELPPDVVCSEILPHVRVFDETIPRVAKHSRLFGRFRRDVTRHPWFIFRNVILSEFDILGAVVKIVEDTTGATVNDIISDFLPAVYHKQVLSLSCSFAVWCDYRGRVNPSARNYLAAYRRLREHISFLPGDDEVHTVFPGTTKKMFRTLPKEHHLRRVTGGGRSEFGYVGWPEINRIVYLELHLRHVINVLVSPKMVQLEILSGAVWGVLMDFDVHLPKIPNITTLDFTHTRRQTNFIPMLKSTFPQIQKITNFLFWGSYTRRSLDNSTDFRRFFLSLPNLTQLDMSRGVFEWPIVLGAQFDSLISSRKTNFHTLLLPDDVAIDLHWRTWIERVTNRLRICARERGEPAPTRINDQLKTLALVKFGITRSTVTPNKVIFESCYFPEATTVLSPRTTEATFLYDCTWVKASSRMELRGRILITTPITIVSDTLVRFSWRIGELYSSVTITLEHLELNMPKLKHVTISTLDSIKSKLVIHSESALDVLCITKRYTYADSINIEVPNGVKILKLLNIVPNITGLENGVDKIYFAQSTLSTTSWRAPSTHINIYRFKARMPVVYVRKKRRSPDDYYKQLFHATSVLDWDELKRI